MPRIFISPKDIKGGHAYLPEAEARRLGKVLRMRPGDGVTLFDGASEHACEILSIDGKSVRLRIISSTRKQAEPALRVLLGHGVPKGEKLEWVLQKAVELGVSAVVPVLLGRSVKRPDAADAGRRLARLRKIATEAAQQSGRTRVPEVPAYMDLPGFIEAASDAELKLVLYEGAKAVGLRDLLRGAKGAKSAALLVGPEGGLREDEVEAAGAAGFVAAGLGPRILRTETAAIAALTIIQYELGDMG